MYVSLPTSFNVTFTKKVFAEGINLKTMTFLLFKVARDVRDINEKDCLFNNKATGLWSLQGLDIINVKKKYEIKNIVKVSWVP